MCRMLEFDFAGFHNGRANKKLHNSIPIEKQDMAGDNLIKTKIVSWFDGLLEILLMLN